MGTVIGGLLMPRFDAGDYGRAMNQGILGGSQMVQGQTALLALQQEKQKQDAEAAMLRAIQTNPALAQQLLGGSTLGALGPGGMPAPGAITQSPLGGGPAQTIPAYPDASRYADVSPQGGGPIPPSVLGQLTPTVTPPSSTPFAPPPPPQGHAPNPALEMARRDPRAAMMLSQQLEQRQDLALKRQEQQLTMGTKVLEYVGRLAQGVTDQASLDAMRQDLQRLQLPQYAAQLPQTYSKEAMAPFIAKATSVLETHTLQLGDLKSQREALSNQQKLIWEQQQHGEKMGLEREKLGQQQTQQQQTQQQQTRSAEFTLQGEYNKLAQPYREVRDAMGRIEAAGTSPTAAGDAALLTAYMKMLDPTTGVRNEEIRNAENVGGLPQRARGWLEWLKGGAPLADDVRTDFMDRSKKLYEQYQKDYEQVGTQYREQATRQGLDPRNVVQDYRSTTPAGGRTAGQPGPKVVTRATLHAEAQRRGVSPEQAEAMARQKGYEVR